MARPFLDGRNGSKSRDGSDSKDDYDLQHANLRATPGQADELQPDPAGPAGRPKAAPFSASVRPDPHDASGSEPSAMETEGEITEHVTISQRVSNAEHAIVDGIEGKDEPIGEYHPAAPFAIVFGAFPIILVIALFIALALVGWWWQVR